MIHYINKFIDFFFNFSREGKEIRDQQACVSLATKDDVNKDPTLKTKAERERILRERNANNTKKFIEERKTLAVRQEKRREKLKNQHEMQLNNLDRYVQNVSILLISVYQEQQSQKYICIYQIFN